jgi:hypothetical protein
MITISQVALFHNPKTAFELGRAMWTALKEIEAFYNFDKKRAIFRRTFLSEQIPDELRYETDETLAERYRQMGREFRLRRSAKQQYARTFDYRAIVDVAKEVLGPGDQGVSYLIVTDLELTPPMTLSFRRHLLTLSTGGQEIPTESPSSNTEFELPALTRWGNFWASPGATILNVSFFGPSNP